MSAFRYKTTGLKGNIFACELAELNSVGYLPSLLKGYGFELSLVWVLWANHDSMLGCCILEFAFRRLVTFYLQRICFALIIKYTDMTLRYCQGCSTWCAHGHCERFVVFFVTSLVEGQFRPICQSSLNAIDTLNRTISLLEKIPHVVDIGQDR